MGSLGVHLTCFVLLLPPPPFFLFFLAMFRLVRVCELVPEGLCLCRLFAGNLDTKWVPTLTSPPKLLCNMVSLQQVSQCILSLASVFPWFQFFSLLLNAFTTLAMRQALMMHTI